MISLIAPRRMIPDLFFLSSSKPWLSCSINYIQNISKQTDVHKLLTFTKCTKERKLVTGNCAVKSPSYKVTPNVRVM
jgi:hypothetical protein